jgi:hypothetical protein
LSDITKNVFIAATVVTADMQSMKWWKLLYAQFSVTIYPQTKSGILTVIVW